jgi:hypothetical protein
VLLGPASTYDKSKAAGHGETLMQRIIASFGLIALTIGTAGPASALSPEDLVGTWKMLSTIRQVEGSDKIIENLGEHPKAF